LCIFSKQNFFLLIFPPVRKSNGRIDGVQQMVEENRSVLKFKKVAFEQGKAEG